MGGGERARKVARDKALCAALRGVARPVRQGRLLAGERAKNTKEERNGREECKRQWNVSRRACVAPWNAAP